MRNAMLVLAVASLVTGCGKSDDGAANEVAKAAQPKKKAAYCFFKDNETKGWAAARDKDGNITVKGEAYRSDSRYKAVLGPPEVSGAAATLSPTITTNDSYSAPDNWWEVNATIPNSAGVDTVTVICGARTLAELKVAPKG
jgi:hypothetical protein